MFVPLNSSALFSGGSNSVLTRIYIMILPLINRAMSAMSNNAGAESAVVQITRYVFSKIFIIYFE